MRSLHNEDRELQIKLAELQADIQIYITICFALFVGLIALMLAFEEIYFTLPPEHGSIKTIFSILIAVAGVFCSSYTIFFIDKAITAKKQMGKLREQYLW